MRVPLVEWLTSATAVAEQPQRLVARQNGRVWVLDPRSVIWVGAEGDYVRFHQAKQSLLVRKTMAAVERELTPSRFTRIHRSAIVNLDFVVELRPMPGGDYRVLLKEGTVLRLSRSFLKRMRPHAGEAGEDAYLTVLSNSAMRASTSLRRAV